MATPFPRTLRSLEADGPYRRTFAVGIGAIVVGGWLAWFLAGSVAIHEVTDRARLEVDAAAHPVAAPVAGRIVATQLQLGKDVAAGDILVELDAKQEELALEEAVARLDGMSVRLEAVRAEIEAERAAAAAHEKAGSLALKESQARVREAEAGAQLAEYQMTATAALREKLLVSEEEMRQVKAAAESSRASVAARELAAAQLDQQYRYQQLDRRATMAELERETASLQAQTRVEEATIRRLRHEVERRLVRAPIAGRLGKTAELHVGSVVAAGEELGAVIPSGSPRVVAFFSVASVGRVRSGQAARLRLHGFPWTRYGALLATVADVGNEPHEGFVRVELTLDPASAPAIPREHGLTGTAEVEVERISPAGLVLRIAGQLLTTRGTSRTSPSAGEEAPR